MSAMSRCHPDLERKCVTSAPLYSFVRYCLAFIDKKRRFDGWIVKQFAKRIRRLNISYNVFFGYSYDSLEMLQQEFGNGRLTIVCQTDPGPAHYRMISEEEALWPEYVTGSRHVWSQTREERLYLEWQLADVIVVNSEWTKDSIISEGADQAKIEVLPLAYQRETENLRRHNLLPKKVRGPLRVLWLGNVAIGKGIQYLVEAARSIIDESVEFIVGGSINISSEAVEAAPKNITWLGQIPRNLTTDLYQDCDVFIFPTLSDGFGITQLEAMAHGLPVITTPNCGSVVEDKVTGFIVPARNSDSLAKAVLSFVHNPKLLTEMSAACLDAIEAFTLNEYRCRLMGIVQRRKGSLD
jgi:glycosyltransferase involved in cell wall biosynthesis